MSTNTTGPAELRRIADALDEQSAVFSSAGWIVITNTTDVRQQAAAWDADRAALEQETFVRQKYGNQLHATEAALDRARALAVELRASINAPSPFPMTAGTIYIVLRIADQIDAALASGGAA